MNQPLTPTTGIDLHIHTDFSDGKYSPEDILCRAADLGLKVVAFTDHDNARGTRQGMSLARELGVELIPAIEFTTRWEACAGQADVDLLAYFIDLDSPQLQAVEQAALEDLYRRVSQCCSDLTAAGMPVTIEDINAENPRYGGLVNLLYAILHKGYASSWKDASKLVEWGWQHAHPVSLTIQEAIQHIHQAGGVAVLAHPYALEEHGEQPLDASRLEELVKAGLDGLEIYHRSAGEDARSRFCELAQAFDLLVTGGSDTHGWFDELKDLGTQPVTQEQLDRLRARHIQVAGRKLAGNQ